MKKILYAVVVIGILCFSFYDEIFPKEFSAEEYYEPSNEYERELYDYAYAQGQKDAIAQMKDAAQSDYSYYVNVEDAGDIIVNQYDEEVRDTTLYHPDLERLTAEDIVDNVSAYVSVKD